MYAYQQFSFHIFKFATQSFLLNLFASLQPMELFCNVWIDVLLVWFGKVEVRPHDPMPHHDVDNFVQNKWLAIRRIIIPQSFQVFILFK